MNLDMLIEIGLTEKEEHFLKETRNELPTIQPTKLTLRKIMIEMYSIKHAEKNTNALINSNKELAKSNEKYAKAMRNLTIALVIVAVLQVIVAVLALYFKFKS